MQEQLDCHTAKNLMLRERREKTESYASVQKKEEKNSHILKAFLCNESLECCCESDISKVDFSYHSTSNQSVSLIDHFFVSANVIANLISYNVFHEGHNLSDHDAICLKLKMPSVCYANTHTGVSYKNVRWERASDSDILVYKGKLFERLKLISLPWDALTCKSFMCKKHHNDIVTFHDCLIAARLDVCNDHIPCISSMKRKYCLPGWNEHVETKRKSAILWHSIWRNNGSPHSDVVADIRRRTRLKYHYAVRYIKNNQDTITNQYMADAILNDKARNFWTEVKKKLNGHNSKIFSVDRSTEKHGICNIFYEKYKCLYSSVPYDNKEMYRLQTDIQSNVDLHCISGHCYNKHSINVEDVYGAVKKLKDNKGDGVHHSFSNNIINAHHISYVYLALLFNSMLVHGVLPD